MRKLRFDIGDKRIEAHYLEDEVLIIAKRAGQKELGGFSVNDAIIRAFELGMKYAIQTIRKEL